MVDPSTTFPKFGVEVRNIGWKTTFFGGATAIFNFRGVSFRYNSISFSIKFFHHPARWRQEHSKSISIIYLEFHRWRIYSRRRIYFEISS